MAIVPLTDELYDRIGEGGEVGRFYKLSPGVENWARRISASAPIAYIEAEFFGGSGEQSVVVWAKSSRSGEPIHAENAINQVLRFFNVQRGDLHDEFEAVGLGRHRRTAAWLG